MHHPLPTHYQCVITFLCAFSYSGKQVETEEIRSSFLIVMCIVKWVSPKALPSLHCFYKCRCTIHPHMPNKLK